jgi:peptide-methionine (S)-S-oxide reductase
MRICYRLCHRSGVAETAYPLWNLSPDGRVVGRHKETIVRSRLLSVLVLGLVVLSLSAEASAAGSETAIFAGGCFWCEESAFEDLPGVISVTSGYTGGSTPNPTYEEVSSGRTGHAESAQVVYDPDKISYEKLLDVYWHNIDPLQKDGQFCDHGTQYRTAIFYSNDSQKRAAEASKATLEQEPRFKGKIATQIVPASKFYPAEAYHQNYCKVRPVQYQAYREGCRRDARLKDIWGAEAGGH